MATDDVFESMARRNLAILGDWATWTSRGNVPRRVRVWLEQETSPQVDGFESVVYAAGWTVEAMLDDLRKEPDKGETFAVNGMVFSVTSILENDGRFVKAAVKRTK
jgi:hypothetical protein